MADECAEVGQAVSPALRDAARAQLAATLKVKTLTLAVLDALAAVNVRPVVLKGHGLATRLFPEQPLARPMVDVDVWVRSDQVQAAEAALQKMGLSLGAIPGVDDAFEEHHHRPWVGRAGLVELHFKLFSGFGGDVFDDASVWARTREGTLEGRAVRWLGAEDEFLYLATHAASHVFLRISWLVDLARYLEVEPQLDWAVIAQRARAGRALVPLATSLRVLEATLGVQLPVGARELVSARVRHHLDPILFSKERLLEARWSTGRVAPFAMRIYLLDSRRQAAKMLLDGARRLWRQREERGG
ncbi:MAG: nucleotidyltransferase family protein [Archangium sp.]|nr:nucleotidyltransferase family protein [Archangium sp.]